MAICAAGGECLHSAVLVQPTEQPEIADQYHRIEPGCATDQRQLLSQSDSRKILSITYRSQFWIWSVCVAQAWSGLRQARHGRLEIGDILLQVRGVYSAAIRQSRCLARRMQRSFGCCRPIVSTCVLCLFWLWNAHYHFLGMTTKNSPTLCNQV